MKKGKRSILVCCVYFAVIGSSSMLHAQMPAWWTERGVLDLNMPLNDFAHVNEGQLKYIAQQAYLEMEEHLPGGGGSNLTAWIAGLANNYNYYPVNVGQLKTMAEPFYDRLIEVGLVDEYPWANIFTLNDFVLGNIGQVKALFDFELSASLSISGTIIYAGPQPGPIRVYGALTETDWNGAHIETIEPSPYTITGLIANIDYWMKAYRDSNTNQMFEPYEAWGNYPQNPILLATNIANADIILVDPDDDEDSLPDWWEQQLVDADPNDEYLKVDHILGTDDYDGDGASNQEEYQFGTDPANPNEVPPIVSFEAGPTRIIEPVSGSVTVNMDLNLTESLAETLTLEVDVEGGTAESGVDYVYDTPDMVMFSVSETNQVITLSILSDIVYEPVETIRLSFEVISGAVLVGRDNHMVLIENGGEDADSDQLPDWWEIEYFETINDYTGEDDPDGDGVNNYIEYLQGRHPLHGVVLDTNDVNQLRVKTPMLQANDL